MSARLLPTSGSRAGPVRAPVVAALSAVLVAALLHCTAGQRTLSSTASQSASQSQSTSGSPSPSPSAPPPSPGALVISAFAGDGVARFAGTGAVASLVRNVSFSSPGGIAYDDGTRLGTGAGSASLLVVADTGNARVRLINLTAGSVVVLVNGTSASDVAFGPGRSIFIADPLQQRVLQVRS